MAKASIRRIVSVIWDKDAARRLEQEAEASLERAGKHSSEALEDELKKGGQKGARALTSSLQREYRLRMARISQQIAEGAINERQFRQEGEKAAREFNRGLSDGINKLRASGGGLTDAQYAGLAGRFKTPRGGRGGMGAGMLLGRFGGPLAGLLGGAAALNESRESIDAFDRMETAIRKLGGTARLTGVDLAFLEENASAAREAFRLSIPAANDLTTEVAKLTDKAGQLDSTGAALGAFLDIGAARGMGAEATLQAVGQAILGIDEGTDKLFGKNPSTLYKEYADRIGTTAGSLTDQQKAQALLDATLRGGENVRGEYLRYLGSAKGEAEQNALKIEEMRAQIGESIQPLREFGQTLKEVVYANLVLITGALAKIAKFGGKTYQFTVDVITTPREVWRRIWGADNGPRLTDTTRERGAAMLARVAAGTQTDVLGRPYRTPAQRNPPPPVPRELSEEEKKAMEKRLAEVEAHIEKWIHSRQAYDAVTQMAGVDRRSPAERLEAHKTGRLRGQAVLPFGEKVEVGETEFDRFLEILPRIHSAAEEAARGMADAFQDAFALMMDEGATVGNFFEGLARGVAGAMSGIIAEFATGKAKENFAAALEAAAYALGFTSHGNFASASAAWASAAQHTAAGLGWAALAGGAAAGGQAVRTRSPGSTFDAGLSTAQRSERENQPLQIYIDPFNPGNPVHVRQIGKGMELDVRLTGRPAWAGGGG